MKIKNMLIISIFLGIILIGLSFNINAEEIEREPLHRQLDFDGDTSDWVYEEPDTSTGTSFKIWETFGGYWADAEKHPTNSEDDLACWGATCSNMLEWTGWGYVTGMEYGNTDTFFEYFQDHTTDLGSLNEYGLEWWFTGYLHYPDNSSWSEEDVEGADFWSSSYTWSDYVNYDWTNTDILSNIESYLTSGYPVGLAIYPINPPGGHAITCWGYNYDPEGEAPNDYYLGVWVTDSDSHKHLTDPNDVIRYYEVEYWDNDTGDTSDDYWYMPNYGGGWKISGVSSLEPFPGESRPVAETGGPYTVNEGTAVSFDASGSSDDDTLEYRWDFDADGTWDTLWSSIPTVSYTWYDDYTGEVYLEVFDGRLRDIDITTVTVNNVAPTVNAGSDVSVDEGTNVNFVGSYTDPAGSNDEPYTIYWDFGDGDTFTGTLNPTHEFCDNGLYTVTLTVTDKDGGSNSDTLSVMVANVPPVVDAGIDQTVDEGDTVTFSGSVSDAGTCDTFSYEWDFGDGAIYSGGLNPNHVYGDNGVFTVILTVTDDDGDSDSDTITLTVNNVAPEASDLGYAWCDENTLRSMIVQNINDPGSDDITITWDWGDGTTTQTTTYYNDGSGPDSYPSPDVNPVINLMEVNDHIYGDNGEFTVTVTITDDDGGVIVVTGTVRVDNVNPLITSEIQMEWPYPENEGYILPIVHNLEFTSTVYDQGSEDITFTWDWDDGTTNTTIYYNDGIGADPYPSPEVNPINPTDVVTHIYGAPGTYTVTLTVTDDDGGSTTDSFTVIVLNIEEAKHHLNNYIQDLPDDYFKGKAENRKNAFNNMFAAIDDMLEEEEYWGMIQHLNNNIRPKCDGTIDGKTYDDWIINADAQYHICAKIDDLTAYIATYL